MCFVTLYYCLTLLYSIRLLTPLRNMYETTNTAHIQALPQSNTIKLRPVGHNYLVKEGAGQTAFASLHKWKYKLKITPIFFFRLTQSSCQTFSADELGVSLTCLLSAHVTKITIFWHYLAKRVSISRKEKSRVSCYEWIFWIMSEGTNCKVTWVFLMTWIRMLTLGNTANFLEIKSTEAVPRYT